METHKLLENQRELLKALVSMDHRSAGEIAEAAGISRPTLVNALNGIRPIAGEGLDNIFKSLNLTKSWKLDPHMVHVWQVGADVNHLVTAVNQLFKNPVVVPLTRTLMDNENDAYRGFFLIYDLNNSFEHGRPNLPYVIVNRDKYRLGKGTKATVNPIDALPIMEGLFANASVSSKPKIVSHRVFPPEQIDIVMSLVEKGVTFDDVNKLIGNVKTTWDTIVNNAVALGLTPDDVNEMLYRYAKAKN